MNILVINCGSSSLKYQLINMNTEGSLAQGLVERIGIEGSVLTQKVEGRDKYIIKQEMPDHKVAIQLVLEALVDKTHGVISSMEDINAVGHRIVHGGERFNSSVIITPDVKDYIRECFKLAPLHNPAHMMGIEACGSLMPTTPMVAVFDNAFHSTMPEEAYLYALPYELYEKHGIRKYGFHGTSHRYVSQEVANVLGKDIKDLKIISCHLGNGSSVCAIKGGKSIDTSMGFTPLAGLAMGTRTGDLDPAIIPFLMREEGLTAEEIDELLNKKSGVLGISGVSSDFRDIEDAAFKEGVHRAKLALDIFNYRVRATIGSYAAIMGGVDAIVFTAGVGENGIETREEILTGLEFLGVEVDKERNNVRGKLREISKEGCKVKAFVVPTNEELVIARDAMELINK